MKHAKGMMETVIVGTWYLEDADVVSLDVLNGTSSWRLRDP